ncbi:MAG: beta-ketoacyl-[acyl-carrier-protein] synthase family protein [Rubrobacteraceae bacterium]|nr:beta-ketoacyl-[acyl-carrier-protein] synthase family protein [Rubrobacteraceae bacterium]MCL6438870.1 beta-ketoacyl-[acyl-carrier-protein] synthase family protein [Rubrobacteraceae bacterium]
MSDGRVRVVVTGLGAVTPFGVGVRTFWEAILSGRSGVGEMDDPVLARWSPVAARARDFDAADHLPKRLVRNTDRVTQMALVAAEEALADAGLLGDVPFSGLDRDRVGISMGSVFGGVVSLEAGAARLARNPSARGEPRLVSKAIPNAPAGALAMRHGLRGPVMTYSTACASSANSIGEALYWLGAGAADAVIAGGTECLFSPAILAGLAASSAIALKGPEDPGAWSRPFAADRRGMVMGEGAAVLVLEPLERALARGARVYAELAGYGTSNDAYHETAPDPSGEGAVLAMERALRSSGVPARDVGYVNAHATATPAGDLAESKALKKVFGEYLETLPVSSIKGAVGHMLGAAGAIESLATVLALQEGVLPPTINCENRDPEAPPDVVPLRSREQQIETAMSNSFGFGGQNAALIWRRA